MKHKDLIDVVKIGKMHTDAEATQVRDTGATSLTSEDDFFCFMHDDNENPIVLLRRKNHQ